MRGIVRGMGSLRQRKDSSYWEAVYKIWDVKKAAWVRKTSSTQCSDKDEAQKILEGLEFAAKYAAGLPQGSSITQKHLEGLIKNILATAGVVIPEGSSAPSLSEYIDTYQERKESTVSDSTLKTYKTSENAFVSWLGSRTSLSIDTLTNADVADYYRHLLSVMSTKSANDRLTWLSGMLNEAHLIDELIPKNPAKSVKRLKAGATLERQSFTVDEAMKLITTLSKKDTKRKDWARAVLISLQTGARLGDCITLRKSDIEDGKLTYQQSKTGKTLTIPLVLRKWDKFLIGSKDPEFLCPNLHQEYQRIGNADLSSEFTGLVSECGVKQTYKTMKNGRKMAQKTFHSLRHTLRSAIVASGGSDAQADLILGHSAGQGKTYTHSEMGAMSSMLTRAIQDTTS